MSLISYSRKYKARDIFLKNMNNDSIIISNVIFSYKSS